MTDENFCLHRREHEVRLVENTNFGSPAAACENYIPLALIVNANLQKPKGLLVGSSTKTQGTFRAWLHKNPRDFLSQLGYQSGGFLYENTPEAWMKYRRVGGGVKSGVAR